MKPIFPRLWVLRDDPVGPLADYLDEFAIYLDRQGYKRHLLSRQIRVVAKFSQWLSVEQIPIATINEKHIRCFFDLAAHSRCVRAGEPAALQHFLSFARKQGFIDPFSEPEPITPVEQSVRAFATYLQCDRGLSSPTLRKYCPFIEQFLSTRFSHGPVEYDALRPRDVIEFIQQQAAHLSPAVSKSATTALRAFFRYLRHSGQLPCDLVAAVPSVPNWTMTGIPRAIAPEHVCAVLERCPRDTPTGRRDFAILLLLARLGLRAGEIVSLCLESIDWGAGAIHIHGKGGHIATLPLPADVGEAISDYVCNGRPKCDSRRLFLRAIAPVRGLGGGQTVTTIVRSAIHRAGLDTPHHGTHQFRHALAADMLRHGADLTEIAGILRHRHIKTTGIYAKVDFAALRPLSLPWPGGAL